MIPDELRLSDDDHMPFGKFAGQRLGDVPDWYFLWFLKQPWSKDYPDLVRYAKVVESNLES